MSKLKPPVNEDDHHQGNKEAAITLVEFGDYECPHCGHAHPLIKRLINKMGNSMNFVFRNFPLKESHPHALTAALAAEAAGKQGKFWEMHDMIYENQERLNQRFLMDLAEQLGLDQKKYDKDYNSEETSGKVELDFESGVRSGVNGTPAFFLNGKQLMTYDATYESLEDAIQLETEINK